jgi:hypothetical protein
METKPAEEPDEKTFVQFVRESPQMSAAESTGGGGGGSSTILKLLGTVARAESEDTFILGLADGSWLELRNEVVQSFEVAQESPERLVLLDVDANALREFPPQIIQQGRLSLKPTDPSLDLNNTSKEPLGDPNTGQEEFALTTSKTTLPQWDPINTLKEPLWDPNTGIADTLVENTNTGLADLQIINTMAEVSTPNWQNLGFPQGGGQIPFVMATPHHAPSAAAMMGNLRANLAQDEAGNAGVQKGVNTDAQSGPITTLKELVKDPLMDTFKEPWKDPMSDPITWVENLGTVMENQGWPGNGPIWNFPGLMF